jgi:organic radical activating enzyme
MTEQKFRYSEVFHSFQGEGTYTGRSTAWIRFFLCNLQCNGFGQTDPTDPSTYILPFEDFDVSSIERIEDLPVWDYGCDSSYTWAKKYKHLAHQESAATICDQLEDTLKHESNPLGRFLHPATDQWHHMAFTGGEPMLKQNQTAMVEIMREFHRRQNTPRFVTVETNGTQDLTDTLDDVIYEHRTAVEWFWSVSPKLWSTAGERPSKAIKPEVVAEYAQASNNGHLKYVVDGSPDSWHEVEEYTRLFSEAGVDWDVYIMPVGATKEEQEGPQIAEIAVEAMKRGYYVAPRVHCYVFGNQIGT